MREVKPGSEPGFWKWLLGNCGGAAEHWGQWLTPRLDQPSQTGVALALERFASGHDSASLSDTMISMQEASISSQATVQVWNKLVAAYHEIMNMQV